MALCSPILNYCMQRGGENTFPNLITAVQEGMVLVHARSTLTFWGSCTSLHKGRSRLGLGCAKKNKGGK